MKAIHLRDFFRCHDPTEHHPDSPAIRALSDLGPAR
jgi:hypothetical protein